MGPRLRRTRLRLGRLFASPEEWTERRLRILAAAVTVLVVFLGIGAVLSFRGMVCHGQGTPSEERARFSSSSPADNDRAAQPGTLSTSRAGWIVLPEAKTLGEAEVGTGFPETPQGALAQLAAIDQRALESGSVITAQDVVSAWAEPGGPDAHTWSVVRAMSILLDAAGLPANGDSILRVTLQPAMGSISGVSVESSSRELVGCVDFILTAQLGQEDPARVAAADCQHLTWHRDHWMIAPGAEPATSASAWPGTQHSYDLGYRWLKVAP